MLLPKFITLRLNWVRKYSLKIYMCVFVYMQDLNMTGSHSRTWSRDIVPREIGKRKLINQEKSILLRYSTYDII